ncbi:MAG: peptide deformylase [Gammaproteobacteria bacterium]
MPALPIILYPHPVLRARAAEVAAIDATIRKLAEQMRETMLNESGVGLAAPQIGKSLRLLVADVSGGRNDPIALANPLIIAHSKDEVSAEEGCLSVPGMREVVRRPARVTVCGVNMQGGQTKLQCEGMLAVCLQHEIDHLNGVLFFDRLSRLKRERLLAKYHKAQAAE